VKTESDASAQLYKQWQHGSEGEKFDPDYRKLFIKLEDSMKQAMSADRMDKHSSGERGWTPPPKGYENMFDE